jgi:phosphotransferase system enzyme I (PtsI)
MQHHRRRELGVTQELICRGTAVSPGIAISQAYVQQPREVLVPNYIIDASKIDQEIGRFHESLQRTAEDIGEAKLRLEEKIGEDHAKIFDAHLLILQDTKAIEDTEELIRSSLMCAEFAFNRVIGRILESFEQIGDSYLRERKIDIEDVRHRLLHNLSGLVPEAGGNPQAFGSVNEESILISRACTCSIFMSTPGPR